MSRKVQSLLRVLVDNKQDLTASSGDDDGNVSDLCRSISGLLDPDKLNDELCNDDLNKSVDVSDVDIDAMEIDHEVQKVADRRQTLGGTTISLSPYKISIRQVLGDTFSVDDRKRLVTVLTSLISCRIDGQELMPLTYDEEANSQAMNNNAATLTNVSLHAARIYAQLVSIPGAFGAGLVDTPCMNALATVVRRWVVESTASQASNSKARKTKRPRKRSAVSNDNSYSDDESIDDRRKKSSIVVLTESIVDMGLQLALDLANTPLLTEFYSWPIEVREGVIVSLVSACSTAAALRATDASMPLCVIVMESSTTALVECMRIGTSNSTSIRAKDNSEHDDDDDDIENGINTSFRDTLLLVIRPLYKVLALKHVLPGGESSKCAAADVSIKILRQIIQVMGNSIENKKDNVYSCSMSSPARTKTRDAHYAETPQVLRSPMSINSEITPNRRTPMTSPKLRLSTPKTCNKQRRTVRRRVQKTHVVFQPIIGCLQKLFIESTCTKASYRSIVVKTMTECLPSLPLSDRVHLLKFVIRLSGSVDATFRLVALETIGSILTDAWLWKLRHVEVDFNIADDDAPSLQTQEHDVPSYLLKAIEFSLLDKVSTVRAMACSLVANLCTLLDTDASENDYFDARQGIKLWLKAESASLRELVGERAIQDDKATVRKPAVTAFAALLVSHVHTGTADFVLSKSDVLILRHIVCEKSPTVRKAACNCLTQLLKYLYSRPQELLRSHPDIEEIWLQSTLPLLNDSDISGVSKAVESFNDIVFDPIVKSNGSCAHSWRIIAMISQQDRNGTSDGGVLSIQSFLAKIMQTDPLHSNSMVAIWKTCYTNVSALSYDQEHALSAETLHSQVGSWLVLEAIAEVPKFLTMVENSVKRQRISLDFICLVWREYLTYTTDERVELEKRKDMEDCIIRSLQVTCALSKLMSHEHVTMCYNGLYNCLLNFGIPLSIVPSAISALVATGRSIDSQARQTHIEQVLSKCESILESNCRNRTLSSDWETTVAALFTIGQVSLIGFTAEESPSSVEKLCNDTLNDDLTMQPTAKLINMIQLHLTHHIDYNSVSTHIMSKIKAHAVQALGKLCLRDEMLAKSSLPLFVKGIYDNLDGRDPLLQSKSLVVLGDLCARYTNLVDRYLPSIAACLQTGISDLSQPMLSQTSRAAIVRRRAVQLVSRLILQDYIKWRGLLFQRFLVASVDEDDTVSAMATEQLVGPLLLKKPSLFAYQLVPSIFVLNKCTAHPMYHAAISSGDAGAGATVGFEGVDLSGEIGKARRMKIYELLMSHISDVDKVEVTARIAKSVLGSALEGNNDLNKVCSQKDYSVDHEDGSDSLDSAYRVMEDTLTILCSPLIRVGRGKDTYDDEDEVEDPEEPNTAKKLVAAKGKLLSNISRKHLVEVLLPNLLSLKSVLEKSCSPLLQYLMHYLVTVYRVYKSEITDFLSGNEQLLQEIEYDARRHGTQRPETVEQAL